jgi:hypothetical protein
MMFDSGWIEFGTTELVHGLGNRIQQISVYKREFNNTRRATGMSEAIDPWQLITIWNDEKLFLDWNGFFPRTQMRVIARTESQIEGEIPNPLIRAKHSSLPFAKIDQPPPKPVPQEPGRRKIKL